MVPRILMGERIVMMLLLSITVELPQSQEVLQHLRTHFRGMAPEYPRYQSLEPAVSFPGGISRLSKLELNCS